MHQDVFPSASRETFVLKGLEMPNGSVGEQVCDPCPARVNDLTSVFGAYLSVAAAL